MGSCGLSNKAFHECLPKNYVAVYSREYFNGYMSAIRWNASVIKVSGYHLVKDSKKPRFQFYSKDFGYLLNTACNTIVKRFWPAYPSP